ncbi:MAG: tetratricopeptide repeat protein [Pseudomonadota bacterium]
MSRPWILGLITCLVMAIAPQAQSGEYFTDPAQLSAEAQALYFVAKGVVDDEIWDDATLKKGEQATADLIALAPNFLPVYIQQARQLMVRGWIDYETEARNQEAAEIILEVIEKDPGYAKAHVLMASIYMNLWDYEKARQALETASQIGTKDPWLQCNWSRHRNMQGYIAPAYEAARACLELASDYPKAAANAVYDIERLARFLRTPQPHGDVTDFLFESYANPLDRISIARRIITKSMGYDGLLAYAFHIIARQRSETPDLPEADVQLARIVLLQAGTGQIGFFPSYRPSHADRAAQLLEPIKNIDSVKDQAYGMLFDIALRNQGAAAAGRVLEQAEQEGQVARATLLRKRAELYFALGNYEISVLLLEELGLKHDPLLNAAYTMVGRHDRVHEYYRKEIRRYPRRAVTLDNYATFLLLDVGDVEQAIFYGERAIAAASYPVARSNLSMAYMVRASKRYQAGNLGAARADYDRARALRPMPGFIAKYCGRYCDEIRSASVALERLVPEIPKAEPERSAL